MRNVQVYLKRKRKPQNWPNLRHLQVFDNGVIQAEFDGPAESTLHHDHLPLGHTVQVARFYSWEIRKIEFKKQRMEDG